MEKLYNDTQYAEAAIEANAEGKFLYRYQHEVEYEAEVLEWIYKEQEVERQKIDPETGEPMYDEEGNPIMETVTIEVAVPKMVKETIIDPETGEEIEVEVQAHHTETFTKMVEELLIDYEGKYVIIDDTNRTECELVEGWSEAGARQKAFEKEFFLIPAATKVNGEDIGVYYRRKPKGYTSATESLLAAFTIASTAGKIDEGIIKVYPVPDFNDPEQVTEEWLVTNQISLPEMTTQEFMAFYSKFLVAWNTIEHVA